MRPATYYYLAQFWSPRTQRQAQGGALPRVRSRGRHARAARRDHAARGLPAFARRVLAVLNGT